MDKELLYNFFQGKTTSNEELRIRLWMEASPENYQTLLNERKVFDAIILLADEKRLRSKTSRLIQYLRYWSKDLSKTAAIIAITLAMTFSLQYLIPKQDILSIPLQKLTVPAGQRINIELADGTIIWLNSRTSIQYPAIFNGDERKVQIDGEAYFEVSHNQQQPFIVETSKGSIQVTGTKFYVESYSDSEKFITSLIEGGVKVIRGNEHILLQPSQMAYLQDGVLKKKPIEDYNIYKWREGLICFKNKTVAEIMERFERCYGIVIKIDNKSILNYKYSGKFRQSDGISYALRVLQKDIKFEFSRDEHSDIIHIK